MNDTTPMSKTADRILMESMIEEDYKQIEKGIEELNEKSKKCIDEALDLYCDVRGKIIKYRILKMPLR